VKAKARNQFLAAVSYVIGSRVETRRYGTKLWNQAYGSQLDSTAVQSPTSGSVSYSAMYAISLRMVFVTVLPINTAPDNSVA
jgi:hypothetical protein